MDGSASAATRAPAGGRPGEPAPALALAPQYAGFSHELEAVVVVAGTALRMAPRAGAPGGPVDYRWTSVSGAPTTAPAEAAPAGEVGAVMAGSSCAAGAADEASTIGNEPAPAAGAVPGDDRIPAPTQPGVYRLVLSGSGYCDAVLPSRVIVALPFSAERDGAIGGYHIGRYPTDGGSRGERYVPPHGFIRVTRDMLDLPLSPHFRLGEFLTHDQADVWPKYVALSMRLIDKLELVVAELQREGVPVRHMVVMSGYRTPAYNRRGLDQGRAVLSRHQWGDAADVWVDNDRDWYMDDLNGDGRHDMGDDRVILRAVNAVERRYPELVGGVGLYPANGVHGPFVHIDARGYRARW
jgi:uncharacterized protein YcbK (DUF882 family)